MRILGIDPGYAILGWGIVEKSGGMFYPVACGAITTPADMPFAERLLHIDEELERIIDKYKPSCMAVEELFFYSNTTTAIAVAEARGVVLLASAKKGLPYYEYTPLQVKQAVVGYGRAEKKQVIAMVTSLLKLPAPPKPDDIADALAVALCHGQNASYQQFLKKT